MTAVIEESLCADWSVWIENLDKGKITVQVALLFVVEVSRDFTPDRLQAFCCAGKGGEKKFLARKWRWSSI
jgi:hypothetical protein